MFSIFNGLVHSFHKYFLSIYYTPSSEQVAKDSVVGSANTPLDLQGSEEMATVHTVHIRLVMMC